MRRSLTMISGILFFLLAALETSYAQAPRPADCSQPMRDPITTIKIEEGRPVQFGTSPDGCWIFVRVGNPLVGINVLRRSGGSVEPFRFVKLEGGGAGNSPVTNSGGTLIVGREREVSFLDMRKLTSGTEDPVVRHIGDAHFGIPVGFALTSDDKRLFVVNYETAWLSAIDLAGGENRGFDRAAITAGIATGTNPSTMILSPDERYLYIPAFESPDPSWPMVCPDDPKQPSAPPTHREGSIQVVDAKSANLTVVATIKAGCSTRRVAVSPDGNTLFAAAGLDRTVLAFDVRPLRNGSSPVLIAKVPVSPVPIGVVVADGGKKLVVASANTPNSGLKDKSLLTVIDIARMASGVDSILGTIPVGDDARNIAVTPDGHTLLVASAGSGTVQIVDLNQVQLEPLRKSATTLAQGTCNQPMRDPITRIKTAELYGELAITKDGCWIFAGQNQPPRIIVLRRRGGMVEPQRSISIATGPGGLVLTRDEKTLIAAAGTQAAFLDVERLISGIGDPVLGYVTDKRFSAMGAAISPNDERLFVTQYMTSWTSIIDLDKVRSGNLGAGAIIGGLPTSYPGHSIFSSDGRYLYVKTAEVSSRAGRGVECRNVESYQPPVTQGSGVLIIDVERIKSSPGTAVVAEARAGCTTNALALSPDGNTLYATSTSEKALFAFDLRPVRTGGTPAPIGQISVGPASVGLAVVDAGKKIVVGPSNSGELTVLDATKVSAGPAAVLGTISLGAIEPPGGMPQKIRVTPDGQTLIVTHGNAIEIIDVQRIGALLAGTGQMQETATSR